MANVAACVATRPRLPAMCFRRHRLHAEQEHLCSSIGCLVCAQVWRSSIHRAVQYDYCNQDGCVVMSLAASAYVADIVHVEQTHQRTLGAMR